jgi:flagellin
MRRHRNGVSPVLSINTNVAAMQALEQLSSIEADLARSQQRITTGLKVSSPKDDPAIWAIAQNQRAQVSSLDAVKDSLARGQSAVGVAMTAGETVSDLLGHMQSLAISAQGYSLGDPSRQTLDDEYQALKRQIDMTVSSADFNGVNLLSAGGTGQVRAIASADGKSTIDVNHVDMSTGGPLLAGLPSDLMAGLGSTAVDDIQTAAKGVNSAIASLGTGSKALETHMTFIGKLQDTLQAAIGNLVDADLAKESAQFQALQVRQQLAIRALQIANQQPSILLQLFQSAR